MSFTYKVKGRRVHSYKDHPEGTSSFVVVACHVLLDVTSVLPKLGGQGRLVGNPREILGGRRACVVQILDHLGGRKVREIVASY